MSERNARISPSRVRQYGRSAHCSSRNVSPDGLIVPQSPSERLTHVEVSETVTKRDAKRRQYTVYIINVITAGGMTWMAFKRFTDFVEFDKLVLLCAHA